MATNTKQPAKAAEGKSKSKTAGTDALAKLKSDHDAVKKLFDKYEKSKDEMSNDDKDALVADICMELTVHAQLSDVSTPTLPLPPAGVNDAPEPESEKVQAVAAWLTVKVRPAILKVPVRETVAVFGWTE